MYYSTAGFTQAIARHPLFEQITLVVIFLNALWIWIDTDYNPGSMLLNSPPFFQIVEHGFCVYFCFEWTLRFGAFEQKLNCFKDAWFVFDSMLVGTMVAETWFMTGFMIVITSKSGSSNTGGLGNAYILRMARLLRLTRMARMVRLLRAAPELLILIKGMMAAMRSVGFTLALLSVILYVFGIAFVQVCEGSECEALFPDVPNTMHTLLLNAALMDSLGSLVEPLGQQSVFLLLLLYAFILIASLTVMNMLIGVICELVSAVAQTEKETLALNYVWEKINELMCGEEGADQDDDNLISKEEFLRLLTHPSQKPARILQDVGVDVVGLVDFVDTIFEGEFCGYSEETVIFEEKKLTFPEFMSLILDLRGGNTATVRDIVNLRKHLNARFDRLEHALQIPSKVPSLSQNNVCAQGINGASPNPKLFGEDAPTFADHDIAAPKVMQTVPSFQDLVNNLHRLLAAHECEVSILFAENQKLQDRLAKLSVMEQQPAERNGKENGINASVAPVGIDPSRSRWREKFSQIMESPADVAFVHGASEPDSTRRPHIPTSGAGTVARVGGPKQNHGLQEWV